MPVLNESAGTTNCPLCGGGDCPVWYEVPDTPVFQNKVYASPGAAETAATGTICLRRCAACGFAFNALFDPRLMEYDRHYHNEQEHSPVFQQHIDGLVKLLRARGFHHRSIVEIGCGKGYFLETLLAHGFRATGFDPAYEGNNTAVVKEYFSRDTAPLEADLIILRHTLEHIPDPVGFLHGVAAANGYAGKLFLEVPDFQWIMRRKAFWDIFYEHCNYFTPAGLGGLFGRAEQEALFNGQYMYLLADLKYLRRLAVPSGSKARYSGIGPAPDIDRYRSFIGERSGCVVWGAGAKGVTFVNLVDPGRRHIACVVDINPEKHNNYIARSAHPIVAPGALEGIRGGDIVVMNENYLEEIRRSPETRGFNLYTVEDIP